MFASKISSRVVQPLKDSTWIDETSLSFTEDDVVETSTLVEVAVSKQYCQSAVALIPGALRSKAWTMDCDGVSIETYAAREH